MIIWSPLGHNERKTKTLLRFYSLCSSETWCIYLSFGCFITCGKIWGHPEVLSVYSWLGTERSLQDLQWKSYMLPGTKSESTMCKTSTCCMYLLYYISGTCSFMIWEFSDIGHLKCDYNSSLRYIRILCSQKFFSTKYWLGKLVPFDFWRKGLIQAFYLSLVQVVWF